MGTTYHIPHTTYHIPHTTYHIHNHTHTHTLTCAASSTGANPPKAEPRFGGGCTKGVSCGASYAQTCSRAKSSGSWGSHDIKTCLFTVYFVLFEEGVCCYSEQFFLSFVHLYFFALFRKFARERERERKRERERERGDRSVRWRVRERERERPM